MHKQDTPSSCSHRSTFASLSPYIKAILLEAFFKHMATCGKRQYCCIRLISIDYADEQLLMAVGLRVYIRRAQPYMCYRVPSRRGCRDYVHSRNSTFTTTGQYGKYSPMHRYRTRLRLVNYRKVPSTSAYCEWIRLLFVPIH